MDTQTAFQLVQQCCINVASKGNVASIDELISIIDKICQSEQNGFNDKSGETVIDALKEYLCFPLVLCLRKQIASDRISEELVEKVLVCLNRVLSRSHGVEWSFFQDVFLQLFVLLTSKESSQKVSSLNEDCKKEALSSVSYLLKALDVEHLGKVCTNEFRPQLGHAVFVCLQLAEKEKGKSVRLEALECLSNLGLCSRRSDCSSELLTALRLAFSNFLPGICISLSRIATAKEIQPSTVVMMSLEGLQYFITLVMSDKFLSTLVEGFNLSPTVFQLQQKLGMTTKRTVVSDVRKPESKFYIKPPDEEEDKSKLKNVAIDRQWIQSTASHISVLITNVATLVTHSHWKVRSAVLNLADALLIQCVRSLSKCLVTMLEIILTLTNDVMDDIKENAQNCLVKFETFLKVGDYEGDVLDLLEERLLTLATQLPTVFRTQDDEKTLAFTKKFSALLKLLSCRLASLLAMPFHLKRVLKALTIALRLDVASGRLLEEKPDNEEWLGSSGQFSFCFVFFRDTRIQSYLVNACHTVGSNGDILVVVDWCLEEIYKDTASRKEVLLLLHYILEGRLSLERKDEIGIQKPVVSSIIDFVLDTNILNSSLYLTESRQYDREHEGDNYSVVPLHECKPLVSAECAKNNVLLIVSTLRVIGKCALMLSEDFTPFLSDILCLVMEKAGGSNKAVASSAVATLGDIAKACGLSSISQLIEQSLPHYWFTLSQKLKRLDQFPASLLVLQFAFRCTTQIEKFTEDLIADVLVSVDFYHSSYGHSLLLVILAYLEAINRSSNEKDILNENKDSSCAGDLMSDGVGNAEKLKVEESLMTKSYRSNMTYLEKLSSDEANTDTCFEREQGNKDAGGVEESGEEGTLLAGDVVESSLYSGDTYLSPFPTIEDTGDATSVDYFPSFSGSEKGSLNNSENVHIPTFDDSLKSDGTAITDTPKGILFNLLTELDDNYDLQKRLEAETMDSIRSSDKKFSDPDTNPTSDEPMEESNAEPLPPEKINLVSQILERCSYLLFTDDRRMHITIFQIICCSCHILDNFENQKLPAFHKLWKPLVLRIKSTDFIVSLQALETSALMIEKSGYFMRKRFISEVMPNLLSFLDSQRANSLLKTETSGYYQTPAFKGQKRLLQSMSKLVVSLDLGVVHTIPILKTVLDYLDTRQPTRLHSEAMNVVRSVASLHPDMVWATFTVAMRVTPLHTTEGYISPAERRNASRREWPKDAIEFYRSLSSVNQSESSNSL